MHAPRSDNARRRTRTVPPGSVRRPHRPLYDKAGPLAPRARGPRAEQRTRPAPLRD